MTAAAPELPPAHPCRNETRVKNWQGSIVARYIWFCDGSAMKITPELMPAGAFNGMMLPDWRFVTEDILTYAIPRPADRPNQTLVEGIGPDHVYYTLSLGPVIKADQLAGLVGALPEDMLLVLGRFAMIVADHGSL